MSDEQWHHVNRTAFSVVALGDNSNELAYWLAQTPQTRMAYLQYLRLMNYGDAARGPVVRVLEVVDLERDE